MAQVVKAIFSGNAFIPQEPCNVPEGALVDLIVQDPSILPPRVKDPQERARILKRLVERIKNNPIPAKAPRFSREELHERR
jgi:hypothetical protein